VLTRCRRILNDHRAKAKPLGIVLDYDAQDLRKLVESSPCCRWCRLPVGFDFHVDHIHPLARGGAMALYNLCISCSRCNRLRGKLTEAETLETLEFLNGLHPTAREDLEARLLAGGPARYARRRRPAG
jgi:5-methylcytosine-specific restriction endonuclease McrA